MVCFTLNESDMTEKKGTMDMLFWSSPGTKYICNLNRWLNLNLEGNVYYWRLMSRLVVYWNGIYDEWHRLFKIRKIEESSTKKHFYFIWSIAKGEVMLVLMLMLIHSEFLSSTHIPDPNLSLKSFPFCFRSFMITPLPIQVAIGGHCIHF